MHLRDSLSASFVLVALLVVGLWAAPAVSYETYDPANEVLGCAQCHSGFRGGFSGPLHQLHYPAITDNCLICHQVSGDDPEIGSGGADPAYGCNGCHEGVGLRAHHANADAPADGNGLLCTACHPNDPTPPAESVPPPFYGRADTTPTDPCLADVASGGEDFDDDGSGLDNDGDLAYDEADTDCEGVPVEASTWGGVKALYR